MKKIKLLLDENIGYQVARELYKKGYDVKSILEIARGAKDQEVLAIALQEKRLLITLDKDFGRLIFYYSQKHIGVIFLCLKKENIENILSVIINILNLEKELLGKFVTATEYCIRIK